MKVVIVGGMAAGPKTAARLRRLVPDAEITIIEQGEYISFGACGMPLYVGNMVSQLDELSATSYGVERDPDFFSSRKDIQVLTGTQAVAIDREGKRVDLVSLATQQQFSLDYDYLVLATGAQAVIPPIEGLGLSGVFTMHRPQDAQALKTYLQDRQAKHVTIIGAGLIGMEMADALSGRRLKVTVCESAGQVLPKLLDPDMARLIAHHMQQRKVDLQLECQVTSLDGDEQGWVRGVSTSKGYIATDAVVIAAGARPRTDLARAAGLEIGATGAIKVDACLRTSDPDIFAAGDCAAQYHVQSQQEVYIPLASTANKQGRVVADNIAGLHTRFDGVQGTTVLQVFDWNIGKTGLSEQEAQNMGYAVITTLVSGHDAPHYYPLHGTVIIKLTADRVSGKLLGAQVSGPGDAIKRLDVLGTAISFGASLQDIAGLDLGYAPPYGEAIDVAIHAANMLENKRAGRAQGISLLELEEQQKRGIPICYLDIREPYEIQGRPVNKEEVLPIPAGELRERFGEVPRDRLVVVLCGLGIRSYDAVCFLRSQGWRNVVYLEGGMSAWLQ